MANPLKIIANGIFKENPTFGLVLGMCPTLAVTTSAENGLSMGLAAAAVLIGSNMAISALRKIIPDEIRIPSFIVVIAGFVTILQLSIMPGVISGLMLGFTLSLTVIGAIRELIGAGTIFGVQVFAPGLYQPMLLAILAPGGFITLGIMMAVMHQHKIRKEMKSRAPAPAQSTYDGWAELGSCSGCALASSCHKTQCAVGAKKEG